MQKIVISVVFTMSCFFAFAQKNRPDVRGFNFSAGAILAVPSNNLPLWSVGVGADLLAQYGITHRLAFTGDAGFTSLFGRKDLKSYTIIPVRLGGRFFVTKRWYGAAKTGVGFLKVKGVEGAAALAYSIGAGYMFARRLDLSLAYDGYSKDGTIGLVDFRLGYFFKKK